MATQETGEKIRRGQRRHLLPFFPTAGRERLLEGEAALRASLALQPAQHKLNSVSFKIEGSRLLE